MTNAAGVDENNYIPGSGFDLLCNQIKDIILNSWIISQDVTWNWNGKSVGGDRLLYKVRREGQIDRASLQKYKHHVKLKQY